MNTLTFKIWQYFVGFAVSIFLLLWLMQVIFLQSYYSSMKKMEVEELAAQIEFLYENTENAESSIDKLAYKNVSNVYVIDFEGNIKYSSYNNNNMFSNSILQIPSRNMVIDAYEIIEKIQESTTKKIKYTYRIDRLKTEIFIYAKLLKNEDILILATSIDPIDATTSVLKNQLIYVTGIALTVSAIISIFISKRISKPIQKMKANAEKLAKGNYKVEFEKAGYSEIDELADTLNFTTGELAKTDRIRRELIANVSHDLRTPLTMIKAYSEMIRDLSGDNKEKREEHLQIIIDETDRLTRLVNDMMDLSKIESGNMKLDCKLTSYTKLVKTLVERIQNMNPSNHFITMEVPENLFSNIDETKMEQVLYNLITNAIHHAGENKEILVKVTATDKKIKTEVIDHGVGIAKEDLPHIFDRYYKCDKSYQRADKGTGLGLSIVKNILIAHHANYGVTSTLGKGSNFWFELPKVKGNKHKS